MSRQVLIVMACKAEDWDSRPGRGHQDLERFRSLGALNVLDHYSILNDTMELTCHVPVGATSDSLFHAEEAELERIEASSSSTVD